MLKEPGCGFCWHNVCFVTTFSITGTDFLNEVSKLENLTKETLEPIINELIKSNDTNFKGVGQPLRIALTGSKFGPGIYDIIISLGKEEVEKRLNNKIIL